MKKKLILFGCVVMASFTLASCGGTGDNTQDSDNHVHQYGEYSYTWNADHTKATSKRVCTLDDSHVEEETVDTTSSVTKDSTCEAAGSKEYVATFKNGGVTQKYSEEIPAGHKYEDVSGKAATYRKTGTIAYKKCSVCDGIVDTENNPIESIVAEQLAFTATVESITEGGDVVTNIDADLFEKQYDLCDLFNVKVGDNVYEIPYCNFKFAVGNEEYGVLVQDTISLFSNTDTRANEYFGLSVGDDITIQLNLDKTYSYSIAALNKMGSSLPVTLSGKTINLEYTSDKYDYYDTFSTTIIETANKEEVDYSDIHDLYQQFIDNYYEIVNQYKIASIKADSTTSSDMYAIKQELYKLAVGMEAKDEEIQIAVSKTKYRLDYFGELWEDEGPFTDEELEAKITAYINDLDPEVSKDKADASTAMKQATTDYEDGKLTAEEAYKAYIAASQTYATLSGYSNYMEYAYGQVYGREYTVSDTALLGEYIKSYIMPAYDALYSEIRKWGSGTWSGVDSYSDKFYGKYIEYLDDYALMMGGDYLQSYETYFTSGNYWYSKVKNENVTGYVSQFTDGAPYMFLGREYQGVKTFIHEFGHYNAALTNGDVVSYDLDETQSQGNEMLFYLFLTQKNTPYASELIKYQAINFIFNIVLGYAINEVEKYAYSADPSTLTESSIWTRWTGVLTNLGATSMLSNIKQETLMNILLNYNCYYISYGLSAVATLELYSLGATDYDKAISAYKMIYSEHDENVDTFTSVLLAAGLKSALSEDAYRAIYNVFVA